MTPGTFHFRAYLLNGRFNMSQMANITVFDGAATPVSHVLTAIRSWKDQDGDHSLWRELSASLPTEACISMKMTERVLRSGVNEVRVRVDVPVMESVGGQNASGYTAAPKVAYVDSYEAIRRKHPRSTITGQRVAKQMLINLLSNVSTTVTPVSAGPVDEAMAQGVLPT